MQSRVSAIQEIEENYEKEEEKIKEQLRKFGAQRDVMTSLNSSCPRNFSKSTILNNCDAESRNLQFLKDLELSKARLRTLTSFSPTDQELRQHVLAYRTSLNTPKKVLNFD